MAETIRTLRRQQMAARTHELQALADGDYSTARAWQQTQAHIAEQIGALIGG